MKKIRDKWQFVFSFRRAIEYADKRRTLRFGIVNFHSFPGEGVMFDKKNYKGFYREYQLMARRVK